MKRLLTLLPLFLAATLFGQNMTLKLEDLRDKNIKSTNRLLISDHMIDGRQLVNFTDTLFITGTGNRTLVFKNFHGADSTKEYKICFKDATLTNSSTNVLIKMNANNRYTALLFKNSKINGKPGGTTSSQLIYYEGEFNKGIRLEADSLSEFNHGRTNIGYAGAAMIQVAGSATKNCNATNWDTQYVIVRGVNGKNARAEFIYIGHYQMINDNTGLPAVSMGHVLIENCKIDGAGREYAQSTHGKSTRIIGLVGTRGSLDGDKLHCSGISINGGIPNVLISKCNIQGVWQPVYSANYGVTGRAVIENNVLVQDTATTAAQALYLKGSLNADGSKKFNYILERNAIVARDYAFAIDGSNVIMVGNSNMVKSFRLFRRFNEGQLQTYTPPPTLKEYVDQLQVTETTTYDGVKTYKFVYRGVELKPVQ